MSKLAHKIVTSLIVIGLVAVFFAPFSINRQHSNSQESIFQPAVAEAVWGVDAAIMISWKQAWEQYIRVKLIDLRKFLVLQSTIRLVQKALYETELGGIIHNYRRFLYDDLLDATVGAVDQYFDNFISDNVSPRVKEVAKVVINNEIKPITEALSASDQTTVTTNSEAAAQPSTTATAKADSSFGQKAVAWVKTFFKAQFMGVKALSPDAPLIAFAQTEEGAVWQNGFSDMNEFVSGTISCTSDSVCNDTLKALEAIDEGMKEYKSTQSIESIRALIMGGYNPERDEDGNEKQWPGLAQALLEGNVQEFSRIVTSSEDYTPSPVTALIGSYIVEYVFNNYID